MTSISMSHYRLHQGYFFLADIFKENEAKMIADRKAAEVYNLKSSIKVTFNSKRLKREVGMAGADFTWRIRCQKAGGDNVT